MNTISQAYDLSFADTIVLCLDAMCVAAAAGPRERQDALTAYLRVLIQRVQIADTAPQRARDSVKQAHERASLHLTTAIDNSIRDARAQMNRPQ